MADRRLMKLALGKGESQRFLVDAGTTVLVVSGCLVLRGPLVWLAENMVAPEQRLGAEQSLVVSDGGWIDLLAGDGVELLLIPPESGLLWKQAVRCLGVLFGNEPPGRTTAPPSS